MKNNRPSPSDDEWLRDDQPVRINAWEWTGSAWSPINQTTVPPTP